MTDQIMSTETELAAIVPEIWSKKFFEVLLANLPFAETISKDWEGEISDLGDTVRIPTVPEFDEAELLDEVGRADASAVTVTTQSLVINKRVVKDYILTKKALLQSIPVMDQLRDLAIYSIQKKIQSEIVGAIVPSASAPDHQIAYDSGSTLALADILEAKELLDAQNVPLDGSRYGVVNSAQLNDIFNITGFTSSDYLLQQNAGAPLSSGFVPPLVGFQIKYTTEDIGSTSYWYHKSFFTMAIQDNLNIEMFNLGVDGKRSVRTNIDLLYGQKQLDNKRVVSIS